MKTVALVDFQTIGHHYSFIRLFAKYLIQNHYRVCIIYPEKCSEIRAYLMEQGAPADAIVIHEASAAKRSITGFGRFNHAISTALHWYSVRVVLRKAAKAHQVRFDAVFFAWLDDFLANYLPPFIIDFIFRHKWSGLYFHPWYLYTTPSIRVSFSSVDSVLRSSNCLSVAVHDEFVLDKLRNRIQKNVLLFPEMADGSSPDVEYSLTREILARGKGRTKIGLIGCEKRKGVLAFLELVAAADSTSNFFFLAGPFTDKGFDEREREYIGNFLNRERDNFFYFPNYIPEGSKINGVISTFDIIFLVYENFLSSSNFSTKAVLFKKRVLATEKYWIGSVTKKYRLGETVPEGNVPAMLLALDRIKIQLSEGSHTPAFESYLDVHREENLHRLFATCFDGRSS